VLEDEPIDLIGFDEIELDQLKTPDPASPDEPVPEREDGPALSRPGDLWRLGPHHLICGDARDADVHARLIGEERLQTLMTDPPYNIEISTIVSTSHREFAHASGEMSRDEFATFLRDVLELAMSRLDDGAIGFVFMDWRQIEILLRVARECGYHYLNLIAWVKANAGMGSFYRSQHELVAVIKKPGRHNNRIQLGSRGRDRSNVWFAPGAGTPGSDARKMLSEHPTAKPVQLLADALIDVTDPGDIILDCFAGSGSTLIAADQTGRRARLIELDPSYCDVILKRWLDRGGEPPILAATGQSLDEVVAERCGDGPGEAMDDPGVLFLPKPHPVDCAKT